METDCGRNVLDSFVVGISLPDDDALEADGVRDISVRVLLDDDRDRFHPATPFVPKLLGIGGHFAYHITGSAQGSQLLRSRNEEI